MERFDIALEKYRADCGGYPDLKMGLKALVANLDVSGWNGPYTKEPLIDPWGRPYLYEISNDIPNVRSLGADGKPGGDLFDGDLSSQNLMAPLHESRLHAARRFFGERIFPWLLFGTSLYAWFRARPRRNIVDNEPTVGILPTEGVPVDVAMNAPNPQSPTSNPQSPPFSGP